jgi:hypothetical protein
MSLCEDDRAELLATNLEICLLKQGAKGLVVHVQ